MALSFPQLLDCARTVIKVCPTSEGTCERRLPIGLKRLNLYR